MANQYYMPGYRLDKALAKLRNQNIPVDILTNSTGDTEVISNKNDSKVDDTFTCYIQRSAQETSVKSQDVHLISSRGALQDGWELSQKDALWRIHTKSAIRDGKDVLISSFNLDPRSYHTNLESGIVIEDCDGLAADVSAEYDRLRGIVSADLTCENCKQDIQKQYFGCGNIIGGGQRDFY